MVDSDSRLGTYLASQRMGAGWSRAKQSPGAARGTLRTAPNLSRPTLARAEQEQAPKDERFDSMLQTLGQVRVPPPSLAERVGLFRSEWQRT